MKLKSFSHLSCNSNFCFHNSPRNQSEKRLPGQSICFSWITSQHFTEKKSLCIADLSAKLQTVSKVLKHSERHQTLHCPTPSPQRFQWTAALSTSIFNILAENTAVRKILLTLKNLSYFCPWYIWLNCSSLLLRSFIDAWLWDDAVLSYTTRSLTSAESI